MHNNCQRKVIPLLNSVSHWYNMKDYYLCYYCNFSVAAKKKKSGNTGCRDDEEEILDSFTDRLVQQKVIKWESVNNKIRISCSSRQKICQPQENGSNKQLSSQNTQESTTNTNEIVKHFLHECHKKATESKKPILLNDMHVHVRHSDNISVIPTIKDVSNILSSVEFKNRAHDLHLAQVMWRNGHFENALNLFWSTYEENLNIRKRIKCILQVNFADAINTKGEAVLVIIINFSKKFVKKYNDYTLLSYVWESCFLSKWHSDNQIASDLLEKYPKLKDNVQLRVHHITSVSLISHKIDVVQRLFEVLLKYDMKTQYELVLRSLFDYACSIRDFYACSAIVQSCSDLDVTLTDIQNSRFINLFCQDDARRGAKLFIKTWSTKPSKFSFKF
ncbi:hypothetical protein R5R35_012009 [Gryllus longicercus]|uniref:Uncharacterized protein n=1 Tax=Gryllus longicercus TaxID=2509291 RepID=A0AAN9VRM9_9ORTH